MSFRFGRRHPKNAPAIQFATLLSSGTLPAFPDLYDSISGWTGWEMLGNDEYGDCVAVSWATERRILTKGSSYPDLSQVETFYETQNPKFPAEDNGMDIQTALEDLVNNGGPDGVKAVAFAKVDHTNIAEMKAALATFSTLWLGVNVTAQNQSQFPNTPWTPTGSVEGGHSIIGTGYDTVKFLMETWASEASLSNDFVVDGTGSKPGLEEAWVVIWPEHLANLSEDALSALATVYEEVTGKSIIFPDPNPVPPPTPAPGPTNDPVDVFVASAKTWLSHKHTSAVNVAFVGQLKTYMSEVLGEN